MGLRLSKKDYDTLRIAMAADEYEYEKSICSDFIDSSCENAGTKKHVIVNKYLYMLENKNGAEKERYENFVKEVFSDFEYYIKLIEEGAKNQKIIRLHHTCAFILRKLCAYEKAYSKGNEEANVATAILAPYMEED